MRDVGLVGLPYSGKSTLFTALSHHGAEAGRPNRAVVPVPDPRLEVVAALERSRSIVPAQLRFLDEPGGTANPQAIAALREVDALCVVLRAFGPDADPVRDLRDVTAELLLADLAVVESALEKARRRARGGRSPAAEVEALEHAAGALAAEVPLRRADLDEPAHGHLRSLGPLTLKPWVVVANLGEGAPLPEELPGDAVGVHAELEAEAADLPEHEARALLEGFGIHERASDVVIRAVCEALGLVTFFTANDEAHAWQVPRGTRAPRAAGAIHSDMERGFIRAEVISYEDLVEAGGWDAAKHRGLLRVEGKEYEVRDGDVLHVRFAV
ncbi:MAG TPA: DUF933 domain-containing protein [Actinomycetota bacterium]|nr:DUF933 domain-containing protein [Actinomycetota bacterium]